MEQDQRITDSSERQFREPPQLNEQLPTFVPTSVNPIDDDGILLQPAGPPSAVPDGRVQRAIRTYAMIFLQTLVTLASGILVTPVLLRLLGAPRIGAQKAVTDWMGYVALTDLGVSGAFSVLLLRARNEASADVTVLVRHAIRILSVLAGFALVAGIVLAWYMPAIVNVPPAIRGELRAASFIMLISVITAPLCVYRIVLDTAQLGYLVSAALLVQTILILLTSLLLAYLGYGLPGQMAAIIVGTVAWTIIVRYWAKKELRRHHVAQPKSQTPFSLRKLWQIAWPLCITTAGYRLNLMTDTIVIGYLLDSKSVALFFLTQRLIFLAAGQINVLSNASWAGLVQLIHEKHFDRFNERIIELSRLIVGTGVVLTGTAGAFNARFIHLWIGSALYGGDLLSVLSVMQSILFGFLLLYTWVLDALGEARSRLFVSSTGSILNLVLSIVFVKMIGIAGVTLGTVCAYILTDVWFGPFLMRRRTFLRNRQLFKAVIVAVCIGLPWTISMWYLARWYIAPYRWAGFACEIGCVGVCALMYCWAFILTKADRLAWASRLRR